jgi:hypothetical protein
LGEGSPTDVDNKAHAKLLAAWQKKERLDRYLLIQKLPDSMYAKYVRKATVAEMWEAIVTEFTHKSMYMQSNLQQEFMSMRAQKGVDLHSEFDRVRVKYETLLNVGIEISENDYRSLIINFVPPELSSVLAQMSMNMKQVTTSLLKAKVIASAAELKGKLPSLVVDPEDLMQAALEEWDRREADKKSRQKGSTSTSLGTALAAVSSEKPGAKSGGGNKRRGKPGECWSCGEKGHKKNDCPNPKKDESGNKDSDKSGGNSNKGKGSSSGSGSNNNSSSNSNKSSSNKKSNANAAVDDDEDTCGAWTAMLLMEDIVDDSRGLIEFDDDKFESYTRFGSHDYDRLFTDDDMPEPETIIDGLEAFNWRPNFRGCEEKLTVIPFRSGECRAEAEKPHTFDDVNGPNGDGIEIVTDLWEMSTYLHRLPRLLRPPIIPQNVCGICTIRGPATTCLPAGRTS